MRKESLKKDGAKNGTMDEIEIDSAAVEQPKDVNDLNGGSGDAVDPLDGVDNADNAGPDVGVKKKNRKGKDSHSVVEVSVPTANNAAGNDATHTQQQKNNADGNVVGSGDDDDGVVGGNGVRSGGTGGSGVSSGDEKSTPTNKNEEEYYEVDEIISHKFEKRKNWYLVRWKNYGSESDTWEPESSLSCGELIDVYHGKNPKSTTGASATSGSYKKSSRTNQKKKITKSTKSVGKTTNNKAKPQKTPAKRSIRKPKSVDNTSNAEEFDYEVADIINQKMEKGKTLYLIRWKGYGPESDTWEPAASVSCPDLIKKYKDRTAPIAAATTKKVLAKKPTATATGKQSKINNVEEEQDYEVQLIVDMKVEKGKKMYLVRWKGYTADSDTWEPEKSLSCPDLIKKFTDEQKAKASKKTVAEKKDIGLIGTKRTASGEIKSPAGSKNSNILKRKNPDQTRKVGERAAKNKQMDTADDDGSDHDDGQDEAEVEAIVGDKIVKGVKMYLVKWKGWNTSSNTWQAESSLSCPSILKKYMASKPLTSGTKIKIQMVNKKVKSTSAKKNASKKKNGGGGNKKNKKQNNVADDEEQDTADDDDEQEWEVDDVLDVKYHEDDTKEFLIRWKGCDPLQDTWEPEGNLTCQDLINKFMNKVDDDDASSKKKTRKI